MLPRRQRFRAALETEALRRHVRDRIRNGNPSRHLVEEHRRRAVQRRRVALLKPDEPMRDAERGRSTVEPPEGHAHWKARREEAAVHARRRGSSGRVSPAPKGPLVERETLRVQTRHARDGRDEPAVVHRHRMRPRRERRDGRSKRDLARIRVHRADGDGHAVVLHRHVRDLSRGRIAPCLHQRP